MIPVTIAVIGGQTKRGPRHGFMLSLAYALGIAITYAAIGAVLAALRRIAGSGVSQSQLAQSPWLALGIGVVCILFAMVMFDKLRLPVPASVQQWQARGRGGGYLGAFAAGLVFGTVASPCLAPVVGLIAIEIAKTGRILYGASMLFTFGLGLGVLFVVIGTFSGVLASLPKAGAWMERVKNGFAWAMLAIACAYMFHAGKLSSAAALARAEAAASTPAQAIRGGGTGSPPYQVAAGSRVRSLEVGTSVGAPAPDADLVDAAGNAVRLSDLWADRTVVLVFYASWCKNCPEKVPYANELAARASDRALVLGVGTTEATSVARLWAREHGVSYDLLFDPQGTLLAAYHPEDPGGLPWTVVIGRDGKVLYRDVAWPRDAYAVVEDGYSRVPAAVSADAPAVVPEPESSAAMPGMETEGALFEGGYRVVPDDQLAPAQGVGARAPDLALQDSSGRTVRLSDWRGQHVILLGLYAGPGWENTTVIEAMNRLAASHPNLKVFAFTGATSEAETKVWGRENGVEHFLVFDPAHEARRLFARDEDALPICVLIDREGTIRHMGPWIPDVQGLAELASGD